MARHATPATATIEVLAALLTYWGKRKWPESLGPTTHDMGDPDGIPGSWLHPGPAPDAVAIWE